MEFINVEVYERLSADDMNNIYNNFIAIVNAAGNYGYNVSDIELQDSLVSGDTPIADILAKMNAVEHNIDILHSLFKWDNEYYKKFIWTATAKARNERVSYWVNWQKNVYNTLINPYTLTDSYNNVITDISGSIIKVLKRS